MSQDMTLLATAGDDCIIRLFDLPKRTLLTTFQDTFDKILAMSFTEDNEWLGVSGVDRKCRIYSMKRK